MTQEDKDNIIYWFEHIAQIADNRKTANGAVMEDSAALDEIKVLAKDSAYYIKNIMQDKKRKLISEIENLKAESIESLRNDTHKDSPEYYSAAGQASAYVKVLNLLSEL